MRLGSVAAAAVLLISTAGAADAATLHFSATLKGADEVPPNTTTGSGEVTATLDTTNQAFSYAVTYSGLTAAAMAAHFHGPAAPGSNAPPIITIKALASPIKGEAMLTEAQIADLKAGRWYFNVHTAAHPTGEIRGQLKMTP